MTVLFYYACFFLSQSSSANQDKHARACLCDWLLLYSLKERSVNHIIRTTLFVKIEMFWQKKKLWG